MRNIRRVGSQFPSRKRGRGVFGVVECLLSYPEPYLTTRGLVWRSCVQAVEEMAALSFFSKFLLY